MPHRIVVLLSVLAALIDQSTEQYFTCGISRRIVSELIVGGRTTQVQDWPWHTIVLHPGAISGSAEYVCGGTLISDRFVLTARHCTLLNGKRLVGRAIVVQFGVQQLYDWNPESFQQHAVLRVHHVPRHDQWRNLRNDVALLELKTVVVFTDYVLPVCLPDRGLAQGHLGTVVGFGLMEGGTVSQTLREAQMPVIRAEDCVQSDRVVTTGKDLVDPGMICAGYTNGTAVCNGDSGGGLVFKRGDFWQLGGVVSFAARRRNDTINGYGVFVNVFHYLPWIVAATGLKESMPVERLLFIPSTHSAACRWVPWDLGQGIPPGGVIVGNDTDGSSTYVARAAYGGDLTIGRFQPTAQAMYVPWDNRGRKMLDFEVLIGQGFRWEADDRFLDGHVPQNAVASGRTDRGDLLFVGRTKLSSEGTWISGPIFPSAMCLYVADGRRQFSSATYEVLVHDDTPCQKW